MSTVTGAGLKATSGTLAAGRYLAVVGVCGLALLFIFSASLSLLSHDGWMFGDYFSQIPRDGNAEWYRNFGY
ncbi:hypothetical protein ACTG4Q_28095 [Bradyrhizobium denitrificans]